MGVSHHATCGGRVREARGARATRGASACCGLFLRHTQPQPSCNLQCQRRINVILVSALQPQSQTHVREGEGNTCPFSHTRPAEHGMHNTCSGPQAAIGHTEAPGRAGSGAQCTPLVTPLHFREWAQTDRLRGDNADRRWHTQHVCRRGLGRRLDKQCP